MKNKIKDFSDCHLVFKCTNCRVTDSMIKRLEEWVKVLREDECAPTVMFLEIIPEDSSKPELASVDLCVADESILRKLLTFKIKIVKEEE